MRHVLVIGKPTRGPQNADTEAVFRKLTSPRVIVRRCLVASELEPTLSAIAAGGLIDVLDIYDHASAGSQMLGDEVLFQSDSNVTTPLIGAEIARLLCAHLTEFARVRLLGCFSAKGPKGRLLLFKLARILGQHRVVFGTNGGVDQHDFDENGFMLLRDVSYLFDSLAAIDGEAPKHNVRIENYVALLGGPARSRGGALGVPRQLMAPRRKRATNG